MDKGESKMSAYIKKYVLHLICLFVVAVLLSSIVYFFAYLCTAEWGYRTIFWKIFLWGLLVCFVFEVVIGEILFFPWFRVYKRECVKGVSRLVAFKTACKEVRIRLPKRLLAFIIWFTHPEDNPFLGREQ